MAKKCMFVFETEDDEKIIMFEKNRDRAHLAVGNKLNDELKLDDPIMYELVAEICPIKKDSFLVIEDDEIVQWSRDAKIIKHIQEKAKQGPMRGRR